MIIDQAKLDELKALAEQATPGPWESTYGNVTTPSGGDVVGIEERGSAYLSHRELVLKNEDADYIAAANPQVVLSLIAELERLRAEIAKHAAECPLTPLREYRAKCCPHGVQYAAECPECCE